VGVSTSDRGGRPLGADLRHGSGAQKVALIAADDVSRKRLRSLVAAAGLKADARTTADADVVVIPSTSLDRLDAARQLRPGALLVAVVPDGDSHAVRAALDAGVDAVVRESQARVALPAAIAAVRAGLVAVPREPRGHPLRPALSPREKQVVGLVVLGMSNGEIARKLHLAETTVKTHLSSAFRKLGVRSRSEAAALVLDPDGGLGLGILSISDGRGG
jgi:DNA-binding NarL/FixJ family response regulator